MKNLLNDVTTFKRGKGNEIMILDISNYRTSVKQFLTHPKSKQLRMIQNLQDLVLYKITFQD